MQHQGQIYMKGKSAGGQGAHPLPTEMTCGFLIINWNSSYSYTNPYQCTPSQEKSLIHSIVVNFKKVTRVFTKYLEEIGLIVEIGSSFCSL